MKQQQHLPYFGIGPLYGAAVIALTAAAVYLRKHPALSFGRIPALRIPMAVLGILLIVTAAILWTGAVFGAKIDANIRDARLVTTGVYAFVRNPIYSAILFACTGVLLLTGNLCFLVLPVCFWLLLTVLVRQTEERWLREMFGHEFESYCKRVNRCIPWRRKSG